MLPIFNSESCAMDTIHTITGFQNTAPAGGWPSAALRPTGDRSIVKAKAEAATAFAKSTYAPPRDTTPPADASYRRTLNSQRELDRKQLAMEEERRAAQQKWQDTLEHTWPLGGPFANKQEPLAFGPNKETNVLTRSYDRKGNPLPEEDRSMALFNSPMIDWTA